MNNISNLLSAIYRDYRRVIVTDYVNPIIAIFFTQGFWALVNYRISHFILLQIKPPVFRLPLLAVMYLWRKVIEVAAGILIPVRTEIGPGLHIAHFGGVWINPEAQIGSNCNLSQGVTVGITYGGKYPGAPRIGNRVYIGSHAIVIGEIEIGDDAAIGAGAVVTKPVPPRAVVVGNPAKIISYKGSFDYVQYDGDQSDPDRLAALRASRSNLPVKDDVKVEI